MPYWWTTCIWRLPISVNFSKVVKPNIIFWEQASMHHLKITDDMLDVNKKNTTEKLWKTVKQEKKINTI